MTRKRHKDGGDSLVSALLVTVLIVSILFTLVDFSIFSSNRSLIQNAARDAARTVSIMGGQGTASMATPIERAYGNTDACDYVEADIARAGGQSKSAIGKAYRRGISTPIECSLLHNLETNGGLVNVEITAAKCSPAYSRRVGQQVRCDVAWSYNGIPASALVLARIGKDMKATGIAESEVRYDQNDLVAR